MRKLLLIIPFVFGILVANAQYTITDQDGNLIADGSTFDVVIPDADTQAEVDWHLHSTNASNIIFEVVSTTQAAASQNLFCVGVHCYNPNTTVSAPEALDANNEALLIMYYKPLGESAPALIDYKISEEGNPNNFITFSISFTIATAIEELTNTASFIAYPNPVNSNVSISYNTSESSEIVMYNIVGEQVRKIAVNPGSGHINIETSDLPAGTYFYSMISNSKVFNTKRLVIKH